MHDKLLAAAAVLALALPAGAQTMKPGLWEMNNKVSGGQMDPALAEMQQQLAQMPPEQRKQMEAMMAQRGVKMADAPGGGMAVQMCMTREMVERSEVPLDKGCTMTRNERSAGKVRFAYTCSNPPSSGEGEASFTPESYASRATIRTVVDGKPETMTMEGKGRWLKADCGNVKPVTGNK